MAQNREGLAGRVSHHLGRALKGTEPGAEPRADEAAASFYSCRVSVPACEHVCWKGLDFRRFCEITCSIRGLVLLFHFECFHSFTD